jgi:peptidyl-prolyl cis-trans isomerase SurA
LKLPSTIALALALTLAGAAAAQTPAGPAAKPSTPPASSQRLDGIAAVVNNEVVLQSDVEEQLYLFLSRAEARVDSATVDSLRSQILKQLIDEKLIVAEAQRLGITVSDAEVNRQAQEALKEAKARFESPAAYRDQLRKENLTEEKLLEKFRDEARRGALVSRMVNKNITHHMPTQAEAEAYYKVHKDDFAKAPAEVRLSVIQIPALPDSVAEKQGRARADGVRKRIAAGEKFAKVAADESDDESSSRSGGDLGYLVRGSMDPAFEKAVFSRKLNAIGEPVRTAYGWHVIEVLDRDTLKTRAGRDSLDREGKKLLEAHVRHVLIRVPLTDDDVERARKLADGVRAQALAGKDFGALARQYSQYAGPHSEDGDIGFLPMTTLQPNIRAGLDSVQVGGVTAVLVNQAGFNIFRVTERKAEREFTLEEIRDELPRAVSDMQYREKLEAWVKGLRGKAHIQINKS